MTYYSAPGVTLYHGDVREMLRQMDAGSAAMCVTSPPYWGLRDYGVSGQLGLDETPAEYIANMVDVFREVRRVLRDDGTLWLNIGDSYAGSGKGPSNNSLLDRPYRGMSNVAAAPNRWISVPQGIKQKDLVGIPWMLAFALRDDGWYLRSDIIWHKPNPMPESVTDRPTKAHEYLFLLTKRASYYYDADAIREAASYPEGPGGAAKARPGIDHKGGNQGNACFGPNEWRNKRSVWTIATEAYPEAHFATFPSALVRPCILAGSAEGGTVLDPFTGSGTTGAVARALNREFVGIDLSEEYLRLAIKRIGTQMPMELAL